MYKRREINTYAIQLFGSHGTWWIPAQPNIYIHKINKKYIYMVWGRQRGGSWRQWLRGVVEGSEAQGSEAEDGSIANFRAAWPPYAQLCSAVVRPRGGFAHNHISNYTVRSAFGGMRQEVWPLQVRMYIYIYIYIYIYLSMCRDSACVVSGVYR